MEQKAFAAFCGLFLLLGCAIFVADAPAAEPARITIDDLKARLGDPGTVLMDVRSGGDWDRSDRKISGAVREDPKELKKWAERYPKDKTIVLYCA